MMKRKLTQSEKRLGLSYMLGLLLVEEVKMNRYELINVLFEHLDDNRKKLINTMLNHTGIFSSFEDMLYFDIINVIFKDSKSNDSLTSIMYEYYKKIYPEVYRAFERSEQCYDKKGEIDATFFKLINNGSDSYFVRSLFGYFLLFWSEIIDDVSIYDINYELLCESADFIITNSKNTEIQSISKCFFLSGEPIFSSVQWKRYLDVKRSELTTFLQSMFLEDLISIDNVYEVLTNKIIDIKNNREIFLEIGINTIWIQLFFYENGVDDEWIANILKKAEVELDIERLSSKYYQYEIINKINKFERETNSRIPKNFLRRDCNTDIKNDLSNIIQLCLLDLFGIFSKDLIIYCYNHFSLATSEDNFLFNQYRKKMYELKKQNEVYVQEISALSKKISDITRKQFDNHSKNDLYYERIISDLQKKVEAKDMEVHTLKEKISRDKEYIELLLLPDEDCNNADVEISVLQSKKYLFVGYIKEALPKLYRIFPNSIFVENDTCSLKNIQVDGIIMFPKIMSHSMYYKVCSLQFLQNIPIIYCNSRNYQAIFNNMLKLFT